MFLLSVKSKRSYAPLLRRDDATPCVVWFCRYLTKLTVLILSDNKIESLIGLERLTALRQLDLSRNEIASFDEVLFAHYIDAACAHSCLFAV